jgi:ATP-dependent Clp protease ATP-binding subunit ClpC
MTLMFERFNEPARRALFFARFEVSQLGGLSIGADHLLLGILRESRGIEDLIPPATRETIRQAVIASATSPEHVTTSVEVPFTPGAKAALERTGPEADALGHQEIGPEHILVALTWVDGEGITELLARHGVTADTLREAIKQRST